MASVMDEARAVSPVDVSDIALYVEDRWREPFASLRATMPVSWCPDSPYGGYWSVASHALVQQVELDPATFSSSWENGNIVIADGDKVADTFLTLNAGLGVCLLGAHGS